MRVLIACEESQRVCIAMRNRGNEAYSCDVQPCSGGHPEWHIMQDVLPLLDGRCSFTTMDGVGHEIDDRWDLIIGHPPCTYLSNAGACRMFPRKGQIDQKRYDEAMKAKAFFMSIYNADCDRIAIENPVPLRVVGLPEKTQVIQPYEYGHPYTKKTYLWLKGLPKLRPTDIVKPVGPYVCGNSEIWKRQAEGGHGIRQGKERKAQKQNFPRDRKCLCGTVGRPR